MELPAWMPERIAELPYYVHAVVYLVVGYALAVFVDAVFVRKRPKKRRF